MYARTLRYRPGVSGVGLSFKSVFKGLLGGALGPAAGAATALIPGIGPIIAPVATALGSALSGSLASDSKTKSVAVQQPTLLSQLTNALQGTTAPVPTVQRIQVQLDQAAAQPELSNQSLILIVGGIAAVALVACRGKRRK